MPLGIDSLSATTPLLRFTALYPPFANALVDPRKDSMHGQRVTKVVEPLVVVATFATSGRWPAQLAAIRKSKSAIIIRISELLLEQFKIRSVVHEDCIDVILAKYVFRVYFTVTQELQLLATTQPKEASQLQAKLVHLPLHHSLIHGLHAKFHSYSAVVRLMTLWLDQQMFSGHISTEALELLVASVYIDNSLAFADAHPLSTTVGFVKTLHKLSEFDWQNSPLIVNLLPWKEASDSSRSLHSFSSADISNIRKEFEASRGSSAAMYIVSNTTKDYQGRHMPSFTAKRPEAVVLKLICKAANLSATALLEWMGNCADSENPPLSIFKSGAIRAMGNSTFSFQKKLALPQAPAGTNNPGNQLWQAFIHGPSFANIQLFSNLSPKELSQENIILL